MHKYAVLFSLATLLFWLVGCGTVTGGSATETLQASPVSTPSGEASKPTAALRPTAQSTGQPSLEPTVPERSIIVELPMNGSDVSSPVRVQGSVSVTPFESTLRGRVYDAGGQVLGEEPILLPSEMGQPGSFMGEIPFMVAARGPGSVEVAEISPKDGAVVVRAVVEVVLVPATGTGVVEIPAAAERLTLPVRILARLGQPGQLVTVSLRWQDGTVLEQDFTTLRGEDGRGLLIDSLNWPGESQPPEPPTQNATLEFRNSAGVLLAQQRVIVLGPAEPDVQTITLYFLLGEELQPVQRIIPKTEAIGTAALEDLLWGPPPPNLAGFGTALPTPQMVLDYPGRESDWGPRVTLRSLTIVDGVATADFSQEMKAYGGGSLRVLLIRQQIERTLLQFPTVQEVRIAVEGETEAVLQP